MEKLKVFWTWFKTLFQSKSQVCIEDQVLILAKIARDYRLDVVKAQGFEIFKSQHDLLDVTQNKETKFDTKTAQISPDEALAWSHLNAGRY